MRPGDTAMQHARAVLEAAGYPTTWARKTAVSRYRGRGREDLYGVFDALVARDARRPLAVQVTSASPSNPHANARKRKRKIEREFLAKFRIFCPYEVEVWAWLPRRHFLVWGYDWKAGKWEARNPIRSPRLA